MSTKLNKLCHPGLCRGTRKTLWLPVRAVFHSWGTLFLLSFLHKLSNSIPGSFPIHVRISFSLIFCNHSNFERPGLAGDAATMPEKEFPQSAMCSRSDSSESSESPWSQTHTHTLIVMPHWLGCNSVKSICTLHSRYSTEHIIISIS